MKQNQCKSNIQKEDVEENVACLLRKKQNGITLIALIITIIVLLILAGIVIKLTIGEDGIIEKAKWSGYVTEYEAIKEGEELYKTNYTLNKIEQKNGVVSDTIIETEERIAMYPVSNKIDINNVSTTLKETIKQIENLNSNEIKDENFVDLYQVDLSKIDVKAKKRYVINIVSGELYSIEHEKYQKKLWHTPRIGLEQNIEQIITKINKAGNYEMIIDAGQTVSWESVEIYYNKYVKNSLNIKIYTSDDEITWKEGTIGEGDLTNKEEKYNLTELERSQYLKIEIEVKEVNGENVDIDYILVNFYKFREIEIIPEIKTTGVEKIGNTYTIPTSANGQTQASGTGTVTQKLTVPTKEGEYMLEIGENYGTPSSEITITNEDGTTEKYTITNNEEIKKIPIKAGATVEITTTLEAGEGVEQVKLLEKEDQLTTQEGKATEKIENIEQEGEETNGAGNIEQEGEETDGAENIEQEKWITVGKQQYVYNNGGIGYWEKCTVNEIEVDETGIITNEEEAKKRIKVTYQVSEDGRTWNKTFSNIEIAENKQYLKVIVEYQTINGIQYGDISNNKIKVILNDGSWKISFVDEDGTEILSKRVYFENSNKQGTLTIPDISKTTEEKQFVCWKIGETIYNPGSTYTVTDNTTFMAYYSKIGIYTVEDLCKFRDEVNSGITYVGKTVNLMNNLDLSTICGEDIGTWIPIGNTTALFSGIFEGNKHVIKKLYFNDSSYQYVGLFANNSGIIQNLILEDLYIYNTYNSATSASKTGGIAGLSSGKIINCGINSGSITSIKTSANSGTNWKIVETGGITARNNGLIKNCYNKMTIKTQNVKQSYNSAYSGGITAFNTGELYNCYNAGNIDATGYYALSAGIAGYSSKKIYNLYNYGSITGSGSNVIQRAGILARNDNSIEVANSYCTTETAYSYYRTMTGAVTTGRIAADTLKGYATQLGDAFTNDIKNEDGIWKYNDGYPILKWQVEE